MPTNTPNFGIPKPLGTENFNRANFNVILDTIDTQVMAKINSAITGLINGAPGALDTLKELSDAFGNDPNFAATVTNLIATKETPAGATAKVERDSYKTSKTNKDSNGIYTTVEHRRKSDNTLVRRSVLSGGTSPLYTTRTVTFFGTDGTTIVDTKTFTLSYDSDGDLISEV